MANSFTCSLGIFAAIGRGPATLDKASSVIMIALGILFGVLAVLPGTRLGGAFMYGKGPSVPIGSAGRVITSPIGVVLVYVAVRDMLH